MKQKLFDFIITTFTVASAALLITMLFTELIHFGSGGLGYFILDSYHVAYYWPDGTEALSEEIWWMAPGLICAAVLLLVPVVLNILGKKATWFFWGNVAVIGVVIMVQMWGLDYGIERIETYTGPTDIELKASFNFPYFALAFAVLTALLYTFFHKSFKKQVNGKEPLSTDQ